MPEELKERYAEVLTELISARSKAFARYKRELKLKKKYLAMLDDFDQMVDKRNQAGENEEEK